MRRGDALRAAGCAMLLGLAAQAPAPPGGGQAYGPPAPPPDQWLPRNAAQLTALDKINARSVSLNGTVGQTLKFGTLSIAVVKCIVRPADQAADAAAFLQITDSRPGTHDFRGWMFVNEPSLNMLESAVYDVRVTGCT